MISDKLLVNLKILGKIQKNGRIGKSYDGIVSLEAGSFLQGLKRILTFDSRKQTLYEINNIINDIQPSLDAIYNYKYMMKEYSSSGEFIKAMEEFKMLIDAMIETDVGLRNLRFTYIRDINTSAQMDIILFRVNNLIRDAKQKYNYFSSFSQIEQIYQLEDIVSQ